MSGLKSIIITVPKSLSKTPGFTSHKLNFTTSLLTDNQTKNHRKMSTTEDEATMDSPSPSLMEQDICFRGKKRRLDHLTWEEKIQRKKLKNRVAAQTSRDRKRAKLDELEDTVRMLRDRNETLAQECSMLKSQNENLTVQNISLRRDLESKTVDRWGNEIGTGSDPDTTGRDTVEDSDPLPPLEELFADLQGDDYIERLEELAESLLREVTAEVEASTHQPSEQVNFARNAAQESSDTARMVGQASENVEANRTRRSINTCPTPVQYPDSSTTAAFCTSTNDTVVSASHENDVKVKEEPNLNDVDTVYGTYDESTNCITIIYPGHEEDIKIQESVQEVVSSDVTYQDEESSYLTTGHKFANYLSPAYTCSDSMSPASVRSDDIDIDMIEPRNKLDSNLSDRGYESHGSPSTEVINTNATEALTDLWHESFSELFPSLA